MLFARWLCVQVLQVGKKFVINPNDFYPGWVGNHPSGLVMLDGHIIKVL